MSSTRPSSVPIPYQRLSDVDFEQPTGIIWPILALTTLREELWSYDPDYDLESYIMYGTELKSATTLFGLPGSQFNWATLPPQVRGELFQRLAHTSAAFHDAYETQPQDKAMCNYVLRWFEAYNTQLSIDDCTTAAGMTAHDHVFSADNVRAGVADLMRELTGSIVERNLATLRALPIVLIDAPDQMRSIIRDYIVEILEVIKIYLIVKMDREYLGAQSLPVDFLDRVFASIAKPLAKYIMVAYCEFILALDKGKGKFSEDDSEHTALCLRTLFFDMGQVFSYQSGIIHPDPPEHDEEEEVPVPEHVANHQYDLYQDNDWFAREYRPVETQPDVLLGPQNVGVDEVSIPVESEDVQQSCALCGDSSIQLRQLKVCGHIMCQNCLTSQLEVNHQCRYKCAYCRAYLLAETA